LATEPVPLEVFATVARNLNDDLRLTQSSPVNKPTKPHDPNDGAFFSTASLEADLNVLIKMTKKAAVDVRRGAREGPLALGWETQDTYHELIAGLSSAYHLSWGVTPSMDDAVEVKEGRGAFGLVLFWGDPSGTHDKAISWLTNKVRDQLYG
jgi:hypothetical protein